MKIKTTMRYYFILVEMTGTKNRDDMQKLEPFYTVVTKWEDREEMSGDY